MTSFSDGRGGYRRTKQLPVHESDSRKENFIQEVPTHARCHPLTLPAPVTWPPRHDAQFDKSQQAPNWLSTDQPLRLSVDGAE